MFSWILARIGVVMTMRFRKANGLVGLDIGSAMVKVVEIAASPGGRRLKHFGAMALRPDAIEDGLVQNPRHVGDVIRELFSQNRIRNRNVALSISGYSAITKVISLPSMHDEALRKQIFLEAERHIPFDLSEVGIDYQLIDAEPGGSGEQDILLVAARKDVIARYVDAAEAGGVRPCLVDVDVFAIQNTHEAVYGALPENIILLHVGAERMSMNFVRNGKSLFIRAIPMGSMQINAKIRTLTGCSDREAEEMKRAGPGKGMSEAQFADILAQVADLWCAELIRAVDFFNAALPGDGVKEVVLSGGGAHVAHFVRALAGKARFTVSLLNPFDAVHVDPDHFDREHILEMAPQAVVAVGLALRKAEEP